MAASSFIEKLEHNLKEGKLTPKLVLILKNFHNSYAEALKTNGTDGAKSGQLFNQFLDLILIQLEKPYHFEPFHKSIRSPIDYYQFGIDFIRPLILLNSSKVLGINEISIIQQQLKQGDNVILFANHQTEPDPQVISILLERYAPELGQDMIFVAGHRVISDPLAVPFSLGRNLLCIFSKKHIEHPPEQKQVKLLHNQKTMKIMGQLLESGGKCIYVAPSGGRDRADAQGKVDVAPFDPSSMEMFYLIAQQSGTPTHFYSLALSTYHLLPPPASVEKELGEHRQAKCVPVHLAFGAEIDMENFPGSSNLDKKSKRKARAEYINEIVKQDYHKVNT